MPKARKRFSKSSGQQSEHLRPVVVDLEKQLGKEIFIRLVDEQKGHWGHVNFDDFKFLRERPKFANEIDPKKKVGLPKPMPCFTKVFLLKMPLRK